MIHKLRVVCTLVRLLFLAFCACVIPRNRRKIIFGSWCGKKFSCNPRAFFEYVLSHSTSYECIWIGDSCLKDDVLKVRGAKFARKGSAIAIWHCLTASFYVCNINHTDEFGNIPYCGRVTILNLGHGTTNKCCGTMQYDGKGHRPGEGKRGLVEKLTSWMFPPVAWSPAASPEEAVILCREFPSRLAPERILPFGYCRNDFLINNRFNHELKERIKHKLALAMGLDASKKWYLYAPTWRHALKDCFLFTRSAFQEKYQRCLDNRNAILIERHHPRVVESLELTSRLEGNIFIMGQDLSNRVDIQELLLVTDVLISDYSSIYFDFGLLDRPVIEFTYDYEFAEKEDFGFEFDLREYAPGPFAYTEEELLSLLASEPEELLKGRTDKFVGYMSYEKGTACESVLKFIEHLHLRK